MDRATRQYCDEISKWCARLTREDRCVQIMEVCGTHTMSIARNGLRALLPAGLRLTSGPGCPVCVTDQAYIDCAVQLAGRSPGAPIIATYGDMVRVPGRSGSLAEARAQGARVEIVYSADQAVDVAEANPNDEVVFLAIGFETTAPGAALAVLRARDEKVANFSILTAHKQLLPAMLALLGQDDVRIDGFLCPGHVSVILGWGAYEEIAEQYSRPCVVAGFDPGQILAGTAAIVRQLAEDMPRACSVYPSVSREGNERAKRLLDEVFEAEDAAWRGLGLIPASGLKLRDEFAAFDASGRFDLPAGESGDLPGCRCGDVICGRIGPGDCPLFATKCTFRSPVGPCMVSSEGACAAAYKYGRDRESGDR